MSIAFATDVRYNLTRFDVLHEVGVPDIITDVLPAEWRRDALNSLTPPRYSEAWPCLRVSCNTT